MKTLYNVAERDYGMDISYGTFTDEAVAQALADQVNKFKGYTDEQDDTRALVYKEYVVEEGDQLFTHRAAYIIAADLYDIDETCPSMYDSTVEECWVRNRLNQDNSFHLTHIQVYGHSAEHAQLRLMEIVERLKEEGLIQQQRERLAAWAEQAKEEGWDE